jgi:hypothetical protein
MFDAVPDSPIAICGSHLEVLDAGGRGVGGAQALLLYVLPNSAGGIGEAFLCSARTIAGNKLGFPHAFSHNAFAAVPDIDHGALSASVYSALWSVQGLSNSVLAAYGFPPGSLPGRHVNYSSTGAARLDAVLSDAKISRCRLA